MTVVPIGETISLAVKLHLQYQESFFQWYSKRSWKNKPKLDISLLGLTLAVFILERLNDRDKDLEKCYEEIVKEKKKIDRLKFRVGIYQAISVIVFYFFLTFAPLLANFAIPRGFNLGSVVATICLSFIYLYGFYLFFQFMAWIRFAFLDLVCNTNRSVQEVITYCRQLVKNSNIGRFDLIARLVTANLVTLPLIFSVLVITTLPRFLPSQWGWFALILLPFFIWVSIEINYFRLTLNTCYYYKMLCLEEGIDLNLLGGKMEIERRVKLLTPESVELEFSLAGIGNRALALLIDYAILFLILFCLGFVWIFVGQQFADTENEELLKWFNAFMFLLYFVIYTGYFVYFETVWTGQSPGKRFTQIRVIKANGRPVGLQQSTLRALLRPFDDFFSFGVLFIIFGKTEKRLGDIVAQTIVIQEPRRPSPIEIKLSLNGEKAEQEWSSLDISGRLNVNDFAVVRDYLQRRENFNIRARSEVSHRLIEEIKSKLELQEIPLGFTPEEHLEGIYRSFRQFYGKY